MLKGCKIRIYPTKKQEEILFIYCKYAHKMRNFLVEKFKDDLPKTVAYGIQKNGEYYNEQDLLNEFGGTEIPIPIHLVRGVIRNYKFTLTRFYGKINHAKPPKFHKYNPNRQSFYIASKTYKLWNEQSQKYFIKMPCNKNFSVQGMSQIKLDEEYVKKFGIINLKEPRFSYIRGKWFLTGAYEISEPEHKKTDFIGLDWGIKNFMTSSTGEFINYPKSVIREFYRINKLKSFRDKKIKGSNNWIKINNKIIKAYERFENLKKNFIEQTTTRLARDNSIAVEDLTFNKIRTSNKNKRRLMITSPLTRFVDILIWKCAKFGTDFKKVNPAYTTQICSCCGNKMNLTLQDRQCNCSCGNHMDRDINAAINIAAKAVCDSL